MTLHSDGDKLTAPLRQDHDGNPILSIEEYRQHLIHDHGYTEANFLPPERPDNLAKWRALDAKHEAARRSRHDNPVDARRNAEPVPDEERRVWEEGRGWTVDGAPLFPVLPEDGSEVRISMEPDPDGVPTLDVAQEQEALEGEPTSVLLGAARILSWYALPITGIIVQAITARRHPDLRAYLTFMAAWNAATTACRTIELHNSWQNRQATR